MGMDRAKKYASWRKQPSFTVICLIFKQPIGLILPIWNKKYNEFIQKLAIIANLE